jgi:hypothetical protein
MTMVAVWPDEKHIKSVISAVENPFLWSPTQRMQTTRCVRTAVSLPQTHWWFQEPCQSGLCVRECSLSRIVQSAPERTFRPPEPNTFSMRRPVDAELHVV